MAALTSFSTTVTNAGQSVDITMNGTVYTASGAAQLIQLNNQIQAAISGVTR